MLSTKSHRTIILVLLVVMIIVISAILVFWINYSQSPPASYSYEIEIIPTPNKGFTVLLPIPCYFNGSTSEIVDDLVIVSGNATYSIEMTEFGRCLNVTGNTTVILRTSGKCDRIPFDNLTLQTNLFPDATENRIYHFSSDNGTPNIKIDISSKLDKGGVRGNRNILIETQLIENGWQLINGIYNNSVT